MNTNNMQPGMKQPMDFSQPGQTREWNESSSAHCGTGTCLLACFCAPCVLQRTYNRYQYVTGEDRTVDTNAMLGSCCCVEVLLFHTGVLGGVLPYMLRDNIRRKLGISGSFFGDLFVSYCCLPCSLSQESAELDNLMKLERPPVPMT